MINFENSNSSYQIKQDTQFIQNFRLSMNNFLVSVCPKYFTAHTYLKMFVVYLRFQFNQISCIVTCQVQKSQSKPSLGIKPRSDIALLCSQLIDQNQLVVPAQVQRKLRESEKHMDYLVSIFCSCSMFLGRNYWSLRMKEIPDNIQTKLLVLLMRTIKSERCRMFRFYTVTQ